MQRPSEAKGSVPSDTILRAENIDREIEAILDRMVHDSPFNFRSSEEGDKTASPARRGLPRHEW